ncbi:energy transducer TonB [Sphingomonas psychrotolerans]|uniref:Protein TonB n=1 Tax=Sphingomonas psychrotolerans TaxID=1327635 RepID=A0ABU3N8P8_9SPHN|nr:energy transducer TonB [Sphingomonas psychrotolerans]MDT8760686.1 energy transducer TonB [Sphingomonas psychrotolerans]
MYAEHRYAPPKSRTVSLGAALLINGALIAGLAFSVPDFIKQKAPTTLTLRDYRDPPVPPLEEPKPEPKADPRVAQMPEPTAPKPTIESESPNTTRTTTDINPPVPPLPPVPNAGPTYVPETLPPPLPPLVAAEQDPRFARDFQPAYPSSELRAQRDGAVRIRILIGTDGRVKAAEPVSATSDAFFEATRRQALAKWRFKPATRGGVPQESWKIMNVRFEIANQ